VAYQSYQTITAFPMVACHARLSVMQCANGMRPLSLFVLRKTYGWPKAKVLDGMDARMKVVSEVGSGARTFKQSF
jgi:hypothetical protein